MTPPPVAKFLPLMTGPLLSLTAFTLLKSGERISVGYVWLKSIDC